MREFSCLYMTHDGKNAKTALSIEPSSKTVEQVAKDYFDAKWRIQKFEERVKENSADNNII